MPREGVSHCCIANLSDHAITLSQGQVIGNFHPLCDTSASTDAFTEEQGVEGTSDVFGDRGREFEADKEVKTKHCTLAVTTGKKEGEGHVDALEALGVKCPDLNPAQLEQFSALAGSYSDIFSKGCTDLGKTGLLEHEINTGDHPPIKQSPRRLPPFQRQAVDQHLDDMLEHDRITKTQSPWSSPIVLAKKNDGSYRLCIDYRRLNQITVKDAHPLPRVDDILESLHGATFFSSVDLASGYWQVKVSDKDRAKTAFVTHRGQFE